MLCRLIIFCCVSVGAASGAELVFDFGKVDSAQTPPGFTNALAGTGRPGIWRAVRDDVSGATNQIVLAQTSADVTDERFPMLIYAKTKFDDFVLTTKFKIVDGVAEQMAGIVFRYQDEKSFYIIRASVLGGNVRFYKVVGGIRSQPIGPNVPVPKGEWIELKIQCAGNKIRAWLNGRDVIPELTDTSFASGQIGFWTKSDSLSRFADTRISYTPKESLAVAMVRDLMMEYPRIVGLKIYLSDETGVPWVVASKEAKEIGEAGGASEKGAIEQGQIFYGKAKDTVSVLQPLRDRNGEPMAAVRVTLKSYPGQTEQAVLQRVLPLVKEMQKRVRTIDELR